MIPALTVHAVDDLAGLLAQLRQGGVLLVERWQIGTTTQ